MTDKTLTPQQPEQTPVESPALKPGQCQHKPEIWSRIVGYYRPTNNWNNGKKEEFSIRKPFKIEKIS